MKLFIPREQAVEETRVPMIPETVKKLVDLGAEVEVESGLGVSIKLDDAAYEQAGATIGAGDGADAVLRLSIPTSDQVKALTPGTIHVSHLDPFREVDLVKQLAAAKVSALAMEMIPRTTLAQKMDSLSSQASLAGYVAVVLASSRLARILPMMMTPAGTLSPSRVFIIGAGVAGLQAIATAKRMGARVEAYDTRPEAMEQILSLGARAVKMDLGETGQTSGGYARQLSEEQLVRQREETARTCAKADIVITTAKVFGRQAPLLLTEEAVAGMRPGSIVVDMAASAGGGNVAGSAPDQEVDVGGVKILGYTQLSRFVPEHASQMYASNLANLIEHFWDKEAKALVLNREDEIMQGALVTHDGEIVNDMIKERVG